MADMDYQQSVMKQFGKNAQNYVNSPLHAKGNDLAWMKQWLIESGKGGILLDVATGGGHVALTFAPFFEQVVALDLTPEMLKVAEKFIKDKGHSNVSFQLGNAEDLPFTDESFDVITCRIAAHHFPQVQLFVQEVYRTLKKDGVLILADNVAPEKEELDLFYNELERRRDPSHFRAYKKSEWISMLEETGFWTESLITFKKKFIFETWCSNMSLPSEKVKELNEWILSSDKDIKGFFSVESEEENVLSFQGQSVVIVALK
ncbi:ubiquinone/menaquinone biosynthesis C-methylase UbiE [Bacillus oleivorans]|uniref:Ubiquinone/menaquinone biosynthesis C-methylase UbiE n=1 Tax=Bacillus oleivorans TaxID=1448271 RepID=A0A285D4A0_9BACI|nr:methyltransferase domain-containing protein [Bacillus oleivorans]SNX74515.1 ubiquinone/menaquinone biosynthesis C-methylase UbiE [Bacillus oleivorans]